MKCCYDGQNMSEIGQLAAFDKMALEQGWYDQAREYFERALALDATNQEAREALSEVEAILARQVSLEPIKPEVEPTSEEMQISREEGKVHLEAQEERIKIAQRERRWLVGIGAAIAVIILLGLYDFRIVAFLFYAGLAIGAISFVGWGLNNFGKWQKKQAREQAQKLAWQKEAWAEQRAQRGGVPLQLGQCPECGSMDSKKFKDIGCWIWLAIVLTLPLGLGLLGYLLAPDAYRCNVCGAKWRA